MCDVLDQLCLGLKDTLFNYQKLFKDHSMPDIRRRDIICLKRIVKSEFFYDVDIVLQAIEVYLKGIKTYWWPFNVNSRLRNSVQAVVNHYRHLKMCQTIIQNGEHKILD